MMNRSDALSALASIYVAGPIAVDDLSAVPTDALVDLANACTALRRTEFGIGGVVTRNDMRNAERVVLAALDRAFEGENKHGELA